MFTRFMNNLLVRGRILRARTRLGWRWALGEMRDVQIAFVLVLINTVIGVALTKLIESNTPSVFCMVITFLLFVYIARKLAAPIWMGELGLVAWREATGVLPSWLRKFIIAPRPATHDVHAGTPGHDGQPVVWHEASIGGHVFHLVFTVCMWSEVILYTCHILPAWLAIGNIIATLIMILCFVATEDFVDVKKWRRRLAFVVAMEAILFSLGPLLFQKVAPGTYHNLSSRWNWHESVQNTEAHGLDGRLSKQEQLRNRLSKENELLEARWNDHLDHGGEGHYDSAADCLAYGDCWRPNDTQKWESNQRRLDTTQTSTTSAMPKLNNRTMRQIFMALGLLGIGLAIMFRS